MTIVGVVDNVQQRPARAGEFDPVVYLPLAANPDWAVNILVQSSSAPGLVASQVQEQGACVIPARRALSIDPAHTLKQG
jgi:hypothetical protein